MNSLTFMFYPVTKEQKAAEGSGVLCPCYKLDVQGECGCTSTHSYCSLHMQERSGELYLVGSTLA